jgi:hypothetical protein
MNGDHKGNRGSMSQIFIGYSHADSTYFQQLARVQEMEGFSAWVVIPPITR